METILALDRLEAAEVVIKTASLSRMPKSLLLRFEHEAGLLRDMGQVSAPLEVTRMRDTVVWIRRFVPGRALDELLSTRRLQLREVLTVGRCVLTALRDAHERGVLHRALRPSHVVVQESGGEITNAVLIGFGLQRSVRSTLADDDGSPATPLYSSPEQAGLLQRDVDERSDLYSAGLVLLECLTGRPMGDAESVHQALRRHHAPSSPDPSKLETAAPPAFDELLHGLLQRDPRRRYQSAHSALADLDSIAALPARGESHPLVERSGHHPNMVEPAFVGRAIELGQMQAALERARHGKGALVLLAAESGAGKTRLLDELTTHAGPAWVLRAAALPHGGQPFQLLRELARALEARVAVDPAFAGRVRAALGPMLDAIGVVLPNLAMLLGALQAPREGPEAFAAARTFKAVARLLGAIGEPGRPAVLLVDDCQWADELMLKLLSNWPQRSNVPCHALVVMAFRPGELAVDHVLRTLAWGERITLPPLSRVQTDQLVRSAAGPLPTDALALIARLSDGSPFMALAILHGLVESGGLVWDGDHWRTEPARLAGLPSSRRAASFLLRRIELLPAAARRLLSLGAIEGKEFDLDFVVALSGETPSNAIAQLEEARLRRMLWNRGQSGSYAFVHERLREALLGRLDEAERRALHRRAAEHFEQSAPSRIFAIAYHYDAAGEPARALPYAVKAAEQARAQHALELAERHYRIAERSAGSAQRDARRDIAKGLGEVLLLRGRFEEASQWLATARALADGDAIVGATIDARVGQLEFERGDLTRAGPALERGLELLGRRVPRGPLKLRLFLLWEILVQLAHTLCPRLLLHRRRLADSAPDLLAVQIYNQLFLVYWFNRGTLACLWAHLRELNLAEQFPPADGLARAWCYHAVAMTLVPLFRRSRRYAERSLALRRQIGDLFGQGQSHLMYGIALYAASRYRESIAHCHEAVALLENAGDRWDVLSAKRHLALCHYRLGELRRSVDESQELYRAGQEIGGVQATSMGVSSWSQAVRGRIAKDLVHAELAKHTDDFHRLVQVFLAEGIRLVAENEVEPARSWFERAEELSEEHGLRQDYVAAVKPWLATALRLELEATPATAAARRRELLRLSRRAVRQALGIAGVYRNSLPHALREAGLLAAMQGRAVRARDQLDRSLAVAEQQEARYERAQTLQARGELGRLLGWSGAEHDLEEARTIVEPIELSLEGVLQPTPADRVSNLSMAVRFSTVLSVGRHIASALTERAAFKMARKAGLSLLRAERCVIVHLGDDGQLNLASSDKTVVCRELVGRALHEASAVADESSATPTTSLPAGVRSALCVPIYRRGVAVAALYADHRLVDSRFGEEEKRLATFIATLVGAALENAAGFSRIHEAVRVRDEFLSIASHELRTPLTSLRLSIERLSRLVRRPPAMWPSDQMISLVERLERSLRKHSALVEQLLDVSRISAGRIELTFTQVDLSALVSDVASRLREDCEHVGATLELDVAPNISGWWDSLRLDSIVANLISNAAKYGAGHPITVRLVGDEATATLTVRDRGIGIALQDRERIFERFERVVSSREYGGFGLGLWIVRQLVEAHGGTIRVESHPGLGSTFAVQLPRRAGEPDRTHPSERTLRP